MLTENEEIVDFCIIKLNIDNKCNDKNIIKFLYDTLISLRLL